MRRQSPGFLILGAMFGFIIRNCNIVLMFSLTSIPPMALVLFEKCPIEALIGPQGRPVTICPKYCFCCVELAGGLHKEAKFK